MVLFAVVAGTIGDLVDLRRRLLLVTETFMLVAAAALGALAAWLVSQDGHVEGGQ